MGFKIFVNGDILDATEVNDFLMKQSVMVFASAAARTSALPAPIEGMVTYLSDTDLLEVFTGSDFVVVNDNTAAILKSIIDAKGDLVVGTAADTPARFAAGTNEHRLVADSGETAGLKYVADTTNFAVAAKADLLVGTAADTLAALTVGTDGHVLTADSNESSGLIWAAAAAGGGKVLQVLSAVTSTAVSTTGTTFVDTGLSAAITPTLATSKILVLISQQILTTRNTDRTDSAVRLMRDSTSIYDPSGGQIESRSNAIIIPGSGATAASLAYVMPFIFLDSPGTTSATTYKTQMANNTSANSAATRAQFSGSTSSIVLIEIGV